MSCYRKDHHMQHHLGVAPPGGKQRGLSGDCDVTTTSGSCLSALGSLALPFILAVAPMITGGHWSSRRHTGKGKDQKDKNSLEAALATFCLHPPHLALLSARDASNDHFFLTRHHAASNNQGTFTRE